VTLAKFYTSLHETTGLGQLVQHLLLNIDERQVEQFHQENENELAGIRDLVPNLRSIHSPNPWSYIVSRIFLDRIRAFEDLELVEFSAKSSKYIDLLELENLKVVDLRVSGDHSQLEIVTEPFNNLRYLALDKLVLQVGFRSSSPLLIHFLESIKAKDVSLWTWTDGEAMSRSLAALNSSITSRMTLRHTGTPYVLDSQLNRFTLLRHLSLGRCMTAHKSFFTAILATPLISL
jgi:hypothetical protein